MDVFCFLLSMQSKYNVSTLFIFWICFLVFKDCVELSNVIGRCGESYGRCNRLLAEYAVYCNTENNWCERTKRLKDANQDDNYDWNSDNCDQPIEAC